MSDYYGGGNDNDDELPLFSSGDEGRPWEGREGRKQKVLERLKLGTASTNDLIQTSTHRFSCEIDELRKDGWRIRVVRASKSQCNYTLLGYQPTMRLKKGMKERYYSTSHWRTARQKRLQFDNFRCCQCGCTHSLQVHHWVYNLFEEDVQSELVTLCEDCHSVLHSRVKIAFPKTVAPDVFQRLELSA